MSSELEKEFLAYHNRKPFGNFAHFCPEFDFMPIDEKCTEIASCNCYSSYEFIKKRKVVEDYLWDSYD